MPLSNRRFPIWIEMLAKRESTGAHLYAIAPLDRATPKIASHTLNAKPSVGMRPASARKCAASPLIPANEQYEGHQKIGSYQG